jgi:hypothetical protein
MFKIIEEFLTIEDLYEIKNILEKSKWVHNNCSTEEVEGAVFWNIILKDKIFEDKILKKLEKYVDKKFEVKQVKINGQTYGLDGEWHRDNDDEGMYTFLIYASSIDPFNIQKIGGYTCFNINNQVIRVEPYQKRAVLFDSIIEHKGLAPLTKNMLRISIAFKLKEI